MTPSTDDESSASVIRTDTLCISGNLGNGRTPEQSINAFPTSRLAQPSLLPRWRREARDVPDIGAILFGRHGFVLVCAPERFTGYPGGIRFKERVAPVWRD